MPGQRLGSPRVGDRGEYLSQFLLSHVASVVPVPRQEDYGVDFVGTLLTEQGKCLRSGRVFFVQVKTTSDKTWSFVEGHHKAWLFSLPLPLLLVFPELSDLSIAVYSTARLWWLKWMVGNSPQKLTLVPDNHPNENAPNPYDRFRHSKMAPPYQVPEIISAKWTVPLGPPIARISPELLREEGSASSLFHCLDEWLWLDSLNILWREQRIPASIEYKSWRTNHAPNRDEIRFMPYENATPGQNIQEIAWALQAPLIAMRNNAKAQGDDGLVSLAERLLAECKARAAGS